MPAMKKKCPLEIRKNAICRWEVMHIPTGLGLGHGQKTLKEAKKFLLYMLAGNFKWEEWTMRDEPPSWANEAFIYRNQYFSDLPQTHRFSNLHLKP